jgi:hypothetical protein
MRRPSADTDSDLCPEREHLPRPAPDEHPGEDGVFVDPEYTRHKRRDPEGERRLHEQHVPRESDDTEHEGDS